MWLPGIVEVLIISTVCGLPLILVVIPFWKILTRACDGPASFSAISSDS
jgi:hypothetical protein